MNAVGERLRRWAGKVLDRMDQIRNLEVAAGLGSKAAQRRLREIEADDTLDGVVRAAAHSAWNRARNVRFVYGMGAEDADDCGGSGFLDRWIS